MAIQPSFNKYGTLKEDDKCNWIEFKSKWGFNKKRKALIEKSLPGMKLLKNAGVETIYIGGSFASKKSNPSDIDGIFLRGKNFDEKKLSNDILLELEDYSMDFYADDMPTEFNGKPHLDFFRRGRFNEEPGLIKVSLKDL